MCVGSSIICFKPNWDVIILIIESSIVVTSSLYQHFDLALKSPNTTIRKGLLFVFIFHKILELISCLVWRSIETNEVTRFAIKFNLKVYAFLKIRYIWNFQRHRIFVYLWYSKDDQSWHSYNLVFLNYYHLKGLHCLRKFRRGKLCHYSVMGILNE